MEASPFQGETAVEGNVRPARLLLLVTLLLPVAGCFGDAPAADAPRLAQPTDTPAFPPSPTPVAPTPAAFDPNDPGYVITSTWQVGDGWDYVSNSTPANRYRYVRVVEERVEDDRRFLRIDEAGGKVGNPPHSHTSYWIDATDFGRLNSTDTLGGTSVFSPPQPLRFFRNGSYAYNETGYYPDGRLEFTRQILANSVYRGIEPVRTGWGTIEAAKVEHRVLIRGGSETIRTLITYRVSDEAAAPVLIDYDGREHERLVAYKVGDRSQSILA